MSLYALKKDSLPYVHRDHFHSSAFCLVSWAIGLSVCPFRGYYNIISIVNAMRAKLNLGLTV